MLYERKPEKAAIERESSSVVQRDQIEKSEYGKEAEAFRNRPIPKVNFDFMKLHSVPIAGPAIQPKLTIGERVQSKAVPGLWRCACVSP